MFSVDKECDMEEHNEKPPKVNIKPHQPNSVMINTIESVCNHKHLKDLSKLVQNLQKMRTS